MHSMAEWYMRGEQHDQNRLSRILDCAQDLKVGMFCHRSSHEVPKVLMQFLNFPFVKQIMLICFFQKNTLSLIFQ